MLPVESTALAVLPLIFGMLVLAFRFYAREGAVSVWSASFVLATLAVVMLFSYMLLLVMAIVPPYSWVVFGGVGSLMAIGGIVSFFR